MKITVDKQKKYSEGAELLDEVYLGVSAGYDSLSPEIQKMVEWVGVGYNPDHVLKIPHDFLVQIKLSQEILTNFSQVFLKPLKAFQVDCRVDKENIAERVAKSFKSEVHELLKNVANDLKKQTTSLETLLI